MINHIDRKLKRKLYGLDVTVRSNQRQEIVRKGEYKGEERVRVIKIKH